MGWISVDTDGKAWIGVTAATGKHFSKHELLDFKFKDYYCPGDCTQRGSCSGEGVCKCQTGFTGEDCSQLGDKVYKVKYAEQLNCADIIHATAKFVATAICHLLLPKLACMAAAQAFHAWLPSKPSMHGCHRSSISLARYPDITANPPTPFDEALAGAEEQAAGMQETYKDAVTRLEAETEAVRDGKVPAEYGSWDLPPQYS